MEKNKLFVLIDKSLEPIYGGVQGGHAVAKWLIDHPEREWNNDYLIYLSCNLDEAKLKLDMLNIDYSAFKEPDLNGKVTAIAVHKHDRLFRKYKSHGFNNTNLN